MKKPSYRKGMDLFSNRSKTRTLDFFEEVTHSTSRDLIAELRELDRDKKKRAITLYICSPGGDCAAGFAIVDFIRNMRCPVKAIAVGEICSMAPAIFIACSERLITENTYVMLHPVSTYSSDYVSFAKSRLKQAEDLETRYDEFFLKHSKIPQNIYDKSKNSELWLNAEEAVKYGIASKILKRK